MARAAQHLTSELSRRFPTQPPFLIFAYSGGLLEKLAQNSLERHRYGAPWLALRQNSKKSPRNLRAFLDFKTLEFAKKHPL
ncbi:MAG: hypothetical protein MR658_05525 [Campylobacter sp.]|uniref:hypothetical protein n=1 Tax=Campylobacter sp. TaxID=205 RepID=UPI002A408DCA|nr:hypothetical protein [Campylobacter sp.]MDD6925620.1 hypothetical protein [Campylobacteraceae bacterium]MCI6178268.1 hypothetical protein [Campylobacter sp.]MDD7090476.1 hypothetical protein [Campylobacteraceae bacterium]MDY3664378.1 hypothetical protein [Campylobacter sp.]MDY5284753.1 hypothetical protein [Campylobacter sp.]